MLKKSRLPERIIEKVLAENLEVIGEGLELVARQYSVPNGRIDILARDKQGRLVVIEVKSGLADDATLTQLLYYTSMIGKGRKNTRNNSSRRIHPQTSTRSKQSRKHKPSKNKIKNNNRSSRENIASIQA